MSAPIDTRPATAPTAPVIVLTTNELRWLEAYRKMDDTRQYYNLIAMEGQARRFPRVTKPTLRLVAGGVA